MAVQDKTEAPTSKKREDARNKGSVAKSMDLNSALVLLVCLALIKSLASFFVQGLDSMLRDALAQLSNPELTQTRVLGLASDNGVKMLILCGPILAAAGAVGFATNVMQVGLKASPQSMAPDLNRMNPISGLAKMCSGRGFVELLKSVLKIFIVGYVVYAFLQAELPNFTKLADMALRDSVSVVALMCWRMMIKAGAAMAMIAIIDYGYQKWSFEQSIKMTKQEVRDEYKMQEGDPQLKGQIRQRQRDMVKQRMMQNVPKADVIITNPTHYAVAIQYDQEKMGAPTVVAKGQRLLAQKIKDVAIANGVPIVENKPVARALYAAVEVGDQIPENLYQAVAEILAYVFRISNKAGRVSHSAAH